MLLVTLCGCVAELVKLFFVFGVLFGSIDVKVLCVSPCVYIIGKMHGCDICVCTYAHVLG